MNAQRFGSAHTETKLQLVSRYLDGYVTALKNQPFQKLYIDAFAGTGTWIPAGAPQNRGSLTLPDVVAIAQGSAHRALKVHPAFDRYVFIEKSARKSRELSQLRHEYPKLADRIEVKTRDANEALLEICKRVNWANSRAVVFLDPFGFQVEWPAIEALGRTKAVDLWYLVPTGIGINRQVTKDGHILEAGGRRIDARLGTDTWRKRLVKTEVTPVDLFGESDVRTVKAGGIDEIAKIVIERLETEFRGGVVKYGLPLGYQGRHFYTLLFACANPSKAARELALRLARAVLKG